MSDILNRFSFLPLPVKSPINCQIEFRLSAAKLKARSEASPQKISNFSSLKVMLCLTPKRKITKLLSA
jgi:hypothetical protein